MAGFKKYVILIVFLFLINSIYSFSQEKTITDVLEWLSTLGTVSIQVSDEASYISVQEKPDPEGKEIHQNDWNTIDGDLITNLSFYKINFKSNDLSLIRKFAKLKTLRISNSNFSHSHFKSIGPMDTLTRLALKKTEIDNRGLEYFKYFKNLEALELNQVNLTGTGFKHLEKLTKLKQITITCSKEMNQHLFHLKKLKLLEDISLYGETTPPGWSYLKDISTLERISCNGQYITDEILKVLSEFENWKTLNIWHSDYVSYSMKTKTHISLRPTQVTGKGLKYLSGLGIKDLVLPKKFKDEDMDYLKDIKDIHKLEILELSDENTKNCLEKLYFLKNLKKLKINNKIKKEDLIPIHKEIPALKFSRSLNLD